MTTTRRQPAAAAAYQEVNYENFWQTGIDIRNRVLAKHSNLGRQPSSSSSEVNHHPRRRRTTKRKRNKRHHQSKANSNKRQKRRRDDAKTATTTQNDEHTKKASKRSKSLDDNKEQQQQPTNNNNNNKSNHLELMRDDLPPSNDDDHDDEEEEEAFMENDGADAWGEDEDAETRDYYHLPPPPPPFKASNEVPKPKPRKANTDFEAKLQKRIACIGTQQQQSEAAASLLAASLQDTPPGSTAPPSPSSTLLTQPPPPQVPPIQHETHKKKQDVNLPDKKTTTMPQAPKESDDSDSSSSSSSSCSPAAVVLRGNNNARKMRQKKTFGGRHLYCKDAVQFTVAKSPAQFLGLVEGVRRDLSHHTTSSIRSSIISDYFCAESGCVLEPLPTAMQPGSWKVDVVKNSSSGSTTTSDTSSERRRYKQEDWHGKRVRLYHAAYEMSNGGGSSRKKKNAAGMCVSRIIPGHSNQLRGGYHHRSAATRTVACLSLFAFEGFATKSESGDFQTALVATVLEETRQAHLGGSSLTALPPFATAQSLDFDETKEASGGVSIPVNIALTDTDAYHLLITTCEATNTVVVVEVVFPAPKRRWSPGSNSTATSTIPLTQQNLVKHSTAVEVKRGTAVDDPMEEDEEEDDDDDAEMQFNDGGVDGTSIFTEDSVVNDAARKPKCREHKDFSSPPSSKNRMSTRVEDPGVENATMKSQSPESVVNGLAQAPVASTRSNIETNGVVTDDATCAQKACFESGNGGGKVEELVATTETVQQHTIQEKVISVTKTPKSTAGGPAADTQSSSLDRTSILAMALRNDEPSNQNHSAALNAVTGETGESRSERMAEVSSTNRSETIPRASAGKASENGARTDTSYDKPPAEFETVQKPNLLETFRVTPTPESTSIPGASSIAKGELGRSLFPRSTAKKSSKKMPEVHLTSGLAAVTVEENETDAHKAGSVDECDAVRWPSFHDVFFGCHDETQHQEASVFDESVVAELPANEPSVGDAMFGQEQLDSDQDSGSCLFQWTLAVAGLALFLPVLFRLFQFLIVSISENGDAGDGGGVRLGFLAPLFVPGEGFVDMVNIE